MSAKPKSDHADSQPPDCLPGPNCMIAVEVLRDLRNDMHQIKCAITGNAEMGQTGLVHRVNAIETKVEAHDRKLFLWGGILAAAGVAATFLKDKLLLR